MSTIPGPKVTDSPASRNPCPLIHGESVEAEQVTEGVDPERRPAVFTARSKCRVGRSASATERVKWATRESPKPDIDCRRIADVGEIRVNPRASRIALVGKPPDDDSG